MVAVSTVFPSLSVSTVVTSDSPGRSSKLSLCTDRYGASISQYVPRIPIWFPSGLRRTKRKPPPTRKSTSHTTSDHPRGPNQRLRRSGLVKASNTNLRGALNTRVSTICCGVGVATASVPVFFIAALSFAQLYGVFWGVLGSGWSTFSGDHPGARSFLPISAGSARATHLPRRGGQLPNYVAGVERRVHAKSDLPAQEHGGAWK